MIIIIIIIVPGPNRLTIIVRANNNTIASTYSHNIQDIVWTAIARSRSLTGFFPLVCFLPSSFLEPCSVYTQCVFSSCSFFSPTISYFYSFFFSLPYAALPHTHSSLPFAVIDGVRQRSTEQRVANSPRQPASEERGVGVVVVGGRKRGGGGD